MITRPSRLYLPKLDPSPSTIFAYVLARFPQIDSDVWRSRVMGGHVTLSDGTAMKLDTAYRHGIMVFYRKEVSGEPEMQEVPVILYRDDHILVVDKPSGIPVTPAGDHVERSLLV